MMKVIPFLVVGCLMWVSFVVFYLAVRERAAAIRALAIRLGVHYLREALPRSLTLYRTPFDGVLKVWNVIDGEPRGIRIIVFDCQVGIGKRSWRRSVMAVENGADFLRSVPFSSGMAMDSAGKWTILYQPKARFELRGTGLIPVGELEARLNALGAAAEGQKAALRR